MPEDTLTVRVDPSNSFDVLSRLGGASDRLGQSGERIGAGFIRGDRVVRTATQNIAAGLLSVNDAASLAVVTMQGLERVFAIGILPTVGVAAAVAAFEVFHKQLERTAEASKELGKELGKAVGLEVQGSVESISSNIDVLVEKMAKLRKEVNSPTTSIFNKFFGGQDDSEAAQLRRAEHGRPDVSPETKEQKQLIDGENRLRELVSARADKEVKIAEAKRDQNKLGVLELTYEDQRAKLFQGAFKSGLNMVDLMKRLIALQINLNTEKKNELDAAAEIKRQAQQTLNERQGDLLQTIGSGKFQKDLQQKQAEQKQREFAAQQIADFRSFMDKGGKLGPVEKAMVDAQDALDKQQSDLNPTVRPGRLAGVGENQDLVDEAERNRINFENDQNANGNARGDFTASKLGMGNVRTPLIDLTNADWTPLFDLSTYDFSGLAPLDGLTISIQ